MASSWRELRVAGLRPVEKIVAVFRINDTRTEDRLRFPFPQLSVSISETLQGGYWASPNVAIKAPNGDADWIGGMGDTIEAALEDCLAAFMRNIGDREWLQPNDFFWSSSVDRSDGL